MKCECPFILRGKPVKGGHGWIVELICGSHNHDLAETLVSHPYAGRLSVMFEHLLNNFLLIIKFTLNINNFLIYKIFFNLMNIITNYFYLIIFLMYWQLLN